MIECCKHVLRRNEYQVKCPADSCDVIWDFPLVRHVMSAGLSVEELNEMEAQITANMLGGVDIKQCPTCSTYCMRERDTERKWYHRRQSNPDKVTCMICTKKSGKKKEFCWKCLQAWNGRGATCGNANCEISMDARLLQLTQCRTKTIAWHLNVPELRGCAQCGVVIQHTDGCNQVTCLQCGHKFCFICLKPAQADGKLSCVGHVSRCRVAPRQTSLP